MNYYLPEPPLTPAIGHGTSRHGFGQYNTLTLVVLPSFVESDNLGKNPP